MKNKFLIGLVILVSIAARSESRELGDVMGCFRLKPITLSRSSTLRKATYVCIKEMLNSKAGDFSFEFLNREGAVFQRMGSSLSPVQPKCPNCFAFRAIDNKIWIGGNLDGITSIKITRFGSSDHFELVESPFTP
jgi:hypothetical protein